MITPVSDDTRTQMDSVQAKVRWPHDHPALKGAVSANQMAVQVNLGPDGVTPDAILLAFGFLAGPLLIGTEAEQREQLASITAGSDLVLGVEPVIRLSVSPAVANRFLQVLTEVMARVNGTNTGDTA